MSALFLLASAVAVIATVLAVTRANAVHALLYFVVSLFSAAFLFLLLGAPFVAVLEAHNTLYRDRWEHAELLFHVL